MDGKQGLRVPARGGFSMLELMVVLVIAAVVVTMGTQRFRKFETAQQLDNARNSVVMMGRRARASAIERGATVQLELNATLQRARITVGGTTVDEVYLNTEYGVAMENGTGSTITVCYNPRGFALTTTCTSGGLPTTVTFSRNGQSAVVQVQALGQIVKS